MLSKLTDNGQYGQIALVAGILVDDLVPVGLDLILGDILQGIFSVGVVDPLMSEMDNFFGPSGLR
jgi:hypothetical protein